MELDEECRAVCRRCYLRHASDEELACVRLDNCPAWRDALGLHPELERAQPGHGRWMLVFWFVVLGCAALWVYTTLRRGA